MKGLSVKEKDAATGRTTGVRDKLAAGRAALP